MIRVIIGLTTALALSACGNKPSRVAYTPAPAGGPVPFASGPISQACLAAGRKKASRARCGCIQAVANQNLSAAQQRRGAGYFSNPAQLQEVRQSDRTSDERFWKAWKAYGQVAAEQCKDS